MYEFLVTYYGDGDFLDPQSPSIHFNSPRREEKKIKDADSEIEARRKIFESYRQRGYWVKKIEESSLN